MNAKMPPYLRVSACKNTEILKHLWMQYFFCSVLPCVIFFVSASKQGWRWAFYISGMPGIILAILIFLSVREPQRTSFASSKEDAPNSHDSVLEMSPCQKLCRTLRMFSQPSLILLCLGGSLRNAGKDLL